MSEDLLCQSKHGSLFVYLCAIMFNECMGKSLWNNAPVQAERSDWVPWRRVRFNTLPYSHGSGRAPLNTFSWWCQAMKTASSWVILIRSSRLNPFLILPEPHKSHQASCSLTKLMLCFIILTYLLCWRNNKIYIYISSIMWLHLLEVEERGFCGS